jgi:DNA-binding CsgD family transcriptional regulator
LEVLALLCEGLPNKLICRRLNIATGTVKVHISGIFRELGVTSRLQAVVVARRCGLLGESAGRTPERTAASTPAAQAETASGLSRMRHIASVHGGILIEARPMGASPGWEADSE